MVKKSVAEVAVEVLAKNNIYSVGWGDCNTLDEISNASIHTTLSEMHTLNHHIRILNILGETKLGQKLFEKRYYKVFVGNREAIVRVFYLKKYKAKKDCEPTLKIGSTYSLIEYKRKDRSMFKGIYIACDNEPKYGVGTFEMEDVHYDYSFDNFEEISSFDGRLLGK